MSKSIDESVKEKKIKIKKRAAKRYYEFVPPYESTSYVFWQAEQMVVDEVYWYSDEKKYKK